METTSTGDLNHWLGRARANSTWLLALGIVAIAIAARKLTIKDPEALQR